MNETEQTATQKEDITASQTSAEQSAALSAQVAQEITPVSSSKTAEQFPQELLWPEDISFSKEAQSDFAQLVQELHLTSQQAQQLIDFETRFARQTAKENEAQKAQWVQETQSFFGPQWQQEVSLAVRAADAFGGPELRALLEETGLGNHPVIVRTFNEIGKRISEDVSPGGSASAGADKTFTEALYGN